MRGDQPFFNAYVKCLWHYATKEPQFFGMMHRKLTVSQRYLTQHRPMATNDVFAGIYACEPEDL